MKRKPDAAVLLRLARKEYARRYQRERWRTDETFRELHRSYHRAWYWRQKQRRLFPNGVFEYPDGSCVKESDITKPKIKRKG